MILFGQGQEVVGGATPRGYVAPKRGFARERVREELEGGGRLPLHVALRCRVRYFTDGVALGSSGFLEDFFEKKRAFFGPRRKSGARRMRGADWGGVRTLRDLQVDVIKA